MWRVKAWQDEGVSMAARHQAAGDINRKRRSIESDSVASCEGSGAESESGRHDNSIMKSGKKMTWREEGDINESMKAKMKAKASISERKKASWRHGSK